MERRLIKVRRTRGLDKHYIVVLQIDRVAYARRVSKRVGYSMEKRNIVCPVCGFPA